MKRPLLFLLALVSLVIALPASLTLAQAPKPTTNKNEKKVDAKTAAEVTRSANGWVYVKGEWAHPGGYKYMNGRVLRTTARPGKPLPKPPGKLALANPEKVNPPVVAPAPSNSAEKTAADKAAEKARNLAPRPAPQTGSSM